MVVDVGQHVGLIVLVTDGFLEKVVNILVLSSQLFLAGCHDLFNPLVLVATTFSCRLP